MPISQILLMVTEILLTSRFVFRVLPPIGPESHGDDCSRSNGVGFGGQRHHSCWAIRFGICFQASLFGPVEQPVVADWVWGLFWAYNVALPAATFEWVDIHLARSLPRFDPATNTGSTSQCKAYTRCSVDVLCLRYFICGYLLLESLFHKGFSSFMHFTKC